MVAAEEPGKNGQVAGALRMILPDSAIVGAMPADIAQ
jgi:hypothetical protein